MRRMILLLLVCLLCLGMIGCKQDAVSETTVPVTEAPTQPVETTVPTEPPTEPPVQIDLLGMDLGQMTPEDAYAAVCQAVAGYRLSLESGGKTFHFTAEDLALSVSEEAFLAWLENEGAEDIRSFLAYDPQPATGTVARHYSRSPVNAGITYDNDAGVFTVKESRDGISADCSDVLRAIGEAVETLSPTASAKVTQKTAKPDIPTDDLRVDYALETANRHLDTELSYVFEAPGVPRAVETLSRELLATFLTTDIAAGVSLNQTALANYVEEVSQRYCGNTTTDQFITTHGTTVNRTVEYYGAAVNQQALLEDMKTCLESFTSDTRTAPYLSAEITGMPYGGNYVEIDLNSQHLWVYRNGQIAVSTDLVSGGVSNRCWTSGGVFSVDDKDTNCWLVGATYRQFVSYWIGFNGSIGIHDANWRSQFGGDIYVYDGSHGCINTPFYAAQQVYNNVSVGTKVIVYGGKTSVGELKQEFTGTDRYVLTTETEPFKLDAKPAHIGTYISYSSSNRNVVRVDQSGTVTVIGPGSATVTVYSSALNILPSATFTIEIIVTLPGEEPPEPETTVPDITEPEDTQPEDTQPEDTQPEDTQPDTSVPALTEPEDTQPSEPEA